MFLPTGFFTTHWRPTRNGFPMVRLNRSERQSLIIKSQSASAPTAVKSWSKQQRTGRNHPIISSHMNKHILKFLLKISSIVRRSNHSWEALMSVGSFHEILTEYGALEGISRRPGNWFNGEKRTMLGSFFLRQVLISYSPLLWGINGYKTNRSGTRATVSITSQDFQGDVRIRLISGST